MQRLLFTLILLGTSYLSTAQLPLNQGSTWSFGRSIIHENLPESYAYRPISILGYFPIEQFGKFRIYGEYQFTQAVNLRNVYDYEFGMNMGIQFIQRINRYSTFAAAIGSGPHFITVETDRQANGFIFSDNFEMSLKRFFPSFKASIQLAARFRHISNAGLQSPNGGIDNLFFLFGIQRNL